MNLATLTQEIAKAEMSLSVSRKQLPILMEEFNKLQNPLFVYYYPLDAKIIAGVKTREEFAPIRALHKGKWDKSVNEECATYRASVNGVEVVINVSEFPPSCKIVEETVHVPAHDEIRRTVICSGAAKHETEAKESATANATGEAL